MTTAKKATEKTFISPGHRTAMRILSPLLIAGAFAGLAGATDAAAAPAQQSVAKAASAAAYTQGFEIRNLSSQRIVLANVENPGNGDAVPYIGTVLRPGESMHYEKVWWFGSTPNTTLTFNAWDDTGNGLVFSVELWVDSFMKAPSIMRPSLGDTVGNIEMQGLGGFRRS